MLKSFFLVEVVISGVFFGCVDKYILCFFVVISFFGGSFLLFFLVIFCRIYNVFFGLLVVM